MKCHSHSVRLCLECLGHREVPANLTVTVSGSTLTVVGDSDANDVTFQGDAGDKTHFTLNSTGTINNLPSPFDSPSGVKNIVVKMLGGADTVMFGNTVPIDVLGNVKIDGGGEANAVVTTDLTVERNFSITNGTNATGTDSANLTNLDVGGRLTVVNGDGDTFIQISRNLPGVSTIKSNLTVTNGTGQDEFFLTDTNVGGNLKINNGHASAGDIAGQVVINNIENLAFRSVIGGNLSVSYLDGFIFNFDAIRDAEIMGNATFNHGSGQSVTEIDNYSTALPVVIHGNLSILGTGTNSLKVGAEVIFGGGAGLILGKKLTVTSGSGDDAITLNNVLIGGDTKLNLGNGANTIKVNDCDFDGRFTLITGAGDDTFKVEANSGTDSATEFKKQVVVSLGDGTDAGSLAFAHVDGFQAVLVWNKFAVTGVESWNLDASQVLFPNGNHIQI